MNKGVERFFIDPESERYGQGGSKIVWQHRKQPGALVKEGWAGKDNPPVVLFRHYITNIVHLLTGGGVPKSKFSFSKPDLQGVEKVDLGKEGDVIRRAVLGHPVGSRVIRRAEDKVSSDPQVIALINQLEKLKVPRLDDQPKNFGINEEGRAVYVDDVYIKGGVHSFIQAVIPEIEKMTDEKRKKEALLYLKRVRELLKKYPEHH